MAKLQMVILTTLLNSTKPLTINEISEITGYERPKVYGSVSRSYKAKYLLRQKMGKNYAYSLTRLGIEIARRSQKKLKELQSDIQKKELILLCTRCKIEDITYKEKVKIRYGLPVCDQCYKIMKNI